MSNSPFEEIRDTDTVRDVFHVAFRSGVPISFWVKDKALQFEAKVDVANKEYIYIDLPNSVSLDDWKKIAAEVFGGTERHLFGSVHIQRTTFFLKLLIAERTDRTLKIYHPNVIYKLQRRQNFRIRLSTVTPPKANLTLADGTALTGIRMLDISTGGMALCVPPENEAAFVNGTKLTDVKFRVMDFDFTVNAVVRYAGPMKTESGKPMIKVGVEFEGMQPIPEKVLSKFVLQESRKLFTAL